MRQSPETESVSSVFNSNHVTSNVIKAVIVEVKVMFQIYTGAALYLV